MKYINTEKLITEIDRLNQAHKVQDDEDYATYELDVACGYDMACEDIISTITNSQNEQPEVDLEKFTEKIDTYKARYKYPENISINGAMAFMARMFYQYPNVARKWYESLPKATMD